jgi:hypothetical protein
MTCAAYVQPSGTSDSNPTSCMPWPGMGATCRRRPALHGMQVEIDRHDAGRLPPLRTPQSSGFRRGAQDSRWQTISRAHVSAQAVAARDASEAAAERGPPTPGARLCSPGHRGWWRWLPSGRRAAATEHAAFFWIDLTPRSKGQMSRPLRRWTCPKGCGHRPSRPPAGSMRELHGVAHVGCTAWLG